MSGFLVIAKYHGAIVYWNGIQMTKEKRSAEIFANKTQAKWAKARVNALAAHSNIRRLQVVAASPQIAKR